MTDRAIRKATYKKEDIRGVCLVCRRDGVIVEYRKELKGVACRLCISTLLKPTT